MRNCRLRPARWPASRKRKPRALAMPTPPRFPFAGPSARPRHPNRRAHQFRSHIPNNQRNNRENSMIDRMNRYGRTAARNHDADGLARRPSSTTIDIHAHIVVPQAAKLAQPHVDLSRIPLAHFADAATKEINAQQDKDIGEVMTTIDRRLFDLDKMGI